MTMAHCQCCGAVRVACCCCGGGCRFGPGIGGAWIYISCWGGAKDQEGKQAYVRCCSEQGKEQVGIGFGHCLARSIEQCKDV
jgi:hypothetical protein